MERAVERPVLKAAGIVRRAKRTCDEWRVMSDG